MLAPLLGTFAFCLSLALPLRAAETFHAGEGWATVELGAGQVNRSTPGFSDNSARFYLGLEGGVALTSRVLLGLELSGWLFQSGNLQDSRKGSGISQAFAVARIYPRATSTFHLQVGAGSVRGWDNAAGGASHSGTGWELGIGYDAMVSAHAAITPFLRYNRGTAGSLSLSTVTIGAGYTWR